MSRNGASNGGDGVGETEGDIGVGDLAGNGEVRLGGLESLCPEGGSERSVDGPSSVSLTRSDD